MVDKNEDNKVSTVAIMDKDNSYLLVGVFEVYNHTFEEVCEELDKIRDSVELWDIEDLVNGLKNKGWKFTWNENVCSYVI